MTKQLQQPLLGVKKQHTCDLQECCHYNNVSEPSTRHHDNYCCHDDYVAQRDHLLFAKLFDPEDSMFYVPLPYESEEGMITTKKQGQQRPSPSMKKKQSVATVCDLPRCCNYVSEPSRDYCCHDHALEGNFMGEGFFDDDTDCMSYPENLVEQAINEGDDDVQVDTHTNHDDATTNSLCNKISLVVASSRRTILTDTRDMFSIRSVTGAIAALASKFKPKNGRVGTWPLPPTSCRSK